MNLYIAHVGFYDDEMEIYELHSNLLVAASNVKTAKKNIKKKDIYVSKKMHIDGIIEILNVDGYDIKLKKSPSKIKNKKFSHDDIKMLE